MLQCYHVNQKNMLQTSISQWGVKQSYGIFFIPGLVALGLCNLRLSSSRRSRSFVSCVKVGDPSASPTLPVRTTYMIHFRVPSTTGAQGVSFP